MFTSSTKLFQGITPASGATAYQISRSLRFNAADSTYLSRTPSVAGNRKTWTWSGWVKRTELTALRYTLFGTGQNGGTNQFNILYYDQVISIIGLDGSTTISLQTSAIYRDISSWYHIVVAVDTTQATSTNRVKLYVNGDQVTSFSGSVYPAQNYDTWINAALPQGIGAYVFSNVGGATDFNSGYIAEVNFIDGQALTPSSFGQTDSATGVWSPKAYTGTYGTNGFYVNFSDNSGTTATTLGKDYSGNGNNLTPNNFSVTAGVGNDSLVDTPTNYGTDTGAGGEVRGNYATINPLMTPQFSQTYTNGNLECTGNYAYVNAQSTICASSGKWYAEAVFNVKNSALLTVGAFNKNISNYIGNSGESGAVGYWTDGTKSVNGTSSSYGATYTVNDVIGVAMDITGNSITFYKNGVSQGAISYTFDSSGAWGFLTSGGGSFASGDKVTWNFGQRPFAYTAPSGFKALCTTNLPTPTVGATSVTLASTYSNVVLYTGNATTNGTTQTVNTVGFQPDFVWIKSRSNSTFYHMFNDSVRGANKLIYSNAVDSEGSLSNVFQSFDTTGFTVSNNLAFSVARPNVDTVTYVAWNWKAGGAASNNTSGTITSNVSVSTTAGFSIVTYTGTGANATVGHSLGVAPKMLIVKSRNNAYEWKAWQISFPTGNHIILNSSAGLNSDNTVFTNTIPTSSVFSIGTNVATNGNGATFVAYCFAEVIGYSKFGSYTGNGSADGPFVYCGFRPRWIMLKRTDNSGNWNVVDTARLGYNQNNYALFPNTVEAEYSAAGLYEIDILSNGFKLRNNGGAVNASGGGYIFAAFAENPFNYSRAR